MPPRAPTTQYFEMLGHRAIYHYGWRAVCPWPGPSFAEAGMVLGSRSRLRRFPAGRHGLGACHVAEDFAENHNVAAEHRDRLIAMIGTWYVEAGKYGVMPVDGSGLLRMIAEKPLVAAPRDSYTYLPGTQSIPFSRRTPVLNRPHSITADVEIPADGAEGVLISQGTAAGGYSFFIKDGKLRYAQLCGPRGLHRGIRRCSQAGQAHAQVRVPADRAARHATRQRGARAPPAVRGRHPRRKHRGSRDHAIRAQPGCIDLRRQPRSCDYRDSASPFSLPAHSQRDMDVSGELIHDDDAELRMHMARQ